jgi:hypothetical protein
MPKTNLMQNKSNKINEMLNLAASKIILQKLSSFDPAMKWIEISGFKLILE